MTQLSLFAPLEQEFADRVCEEFNRLDTVFKGKFYVDECRLEKWDHVNLKEKVLFICLKADGVCTENSFIQFGGDRKSQYNIYNVGMYSEWIADKCRDSDLSINVTPWNIYIFYHNFERKNIKL